MLQAGSGVKSAGNLQAMARGWLPLSRDEFEIGSQETGFKSWLGCY